MSVHFFRLAAPIPPTAVELGITSTDTTVVPPPTVTAKTLTHFFFRLSDLLNNI
jgi:hypothetical protein